MTTEPRRTCPNCGHEFPGAMQYCPVCLFRKAVAGNEDSDDTLVNSSEIKERAPGENATDGSFTTIERLGRACQIVPAKWSHYSWQ